VQPVSALLASEEIKKVQTLFALLNYYQFSALRLSQISWSHRIALIDRVEGTEATEYYIKRTINEGWSVRVLRHKIEQKLYESQGTLPNNFDLTLPTDQSALVKNILKDPYIFDFFSFSF